MNGEIDFGRVGERLVRRAFVLFGLVPVFEMTADEVAAHLRFRMAQAHPGPAAPPGAPDPSSGATARAPAPRA